MSEALRPRLSTSDYWTGRPALRVRCPVCGSEWQHHGAVTVYEREGGEDGETTVTTVGGSMPVESPNPSPRRGAVQIAFVGECEHEWLLDIVQHKGETFVFATTVAL